MNTIAPTLHQTWKNFCLNSLEIVHFEPWKPELEFTVLSLSKTRDLYLKTIEALGELGSQDPDIEKLYVPFVLNKEHYHGDTSARLAILNAIEKIGLWNKNIQDILIIFMNDQKMEVKLLAIKLAGNLVKCGVFDEKYGDSRVMSALVKVFEQATEEKNSDLVMALIEAFTHLNLYSPEFSSLDIIEGLSDVSPECREKMRTILFSMQDPNVRKLFPKNDSDEAWDLVQILEKFTRIIVSDPEPVHRQAALVSIQTLRIWNAALRDVVLIALVKDSDLPVRCTAAQVLETLERDQNPCVLQALIELSSSAVISLRQTTTKALGALGCWNEAIENALVVNLKDHDPLVRAYAAEAIGNLSPRSYSENRIHSLANCMLDPEPSVRLASVKAFDKVARFDDQERQKLLRLLSDPDPEVRTAVFDSFKTYRTSNKTIHKALLNACRDRHTPARLSAIECLGQIDGLFSDIYPELSRAMTDSNPEVSLAALKALAHHFSDTSCLVELEAMMTQLPTVPLLPEAVPEQKWRALHDDLQPAAVAPVRHYSFLGNLQRTGSPDETKDEDTVSTNEASL